MVATLTKPVTKLKIQPKQKTEAKQKVEPLSNGQNGIPPLSPGDFLTRAEFEKRYHAHPEIKKAELIEGIVYMPSPVRISQHGDPHFVMITWLGNYCLVTPGVRGSDNASVRLDLVNEPQPDALLRLDRSAGGRSVVSLDDYLEGPPELVVEIAASSASYDLHQKRDTYARHGVQEYLVLQMYGRIATWFALRDHGYEALLPDQEGILRSEVFPGLWFHAPAFWRNDLATVFSVLQQGLASPEHQAFVEILKARIDKP